MNHEKHKSIEGGVLIIALIICGMGAIGLTAWLSVITARSGQVEQIETALQRRIIAQNGLAAAKEYFYQKVVTELAGAAHTETLPGSGGITTWGTFTLPAWGGVGLAGPLESPDASPINQFSPNPYNCFAKDFSITIGDGTSNLNYTLRVRSFPLALGGDVFCMHKPTLSPGQTNLVTGNIDVRARAVLWTAEAPHSFGDLDAERYLSRDVASSGLSLDDPSTGLQVRPDNFPMPPMVNNLYGGLPVYDGELNVVDGGVGNEENSILDKMGTAEVVDGYTSRPWTNGVYCDGGGIVEISLLDSTYTAIRLQNVAHIILRGQVDVDEEDDAEIMSPLTIVNTWTDPLQLEPLTLQMYNSNKRRLNIGLKKVVAPGSISAIFWNSDTDPTWRMTLTLENTSIDFINYYQGAVTVEGGIRTDRSVEHRGWLTPLAPGSLTFDEDPSPGALESLDARMAWVESYWQ